MNDPHPLPKGRLLAALAQARIARAYQAKVEALDNDPEVLRLRAAGHLVVATRGVRIVIRGLGKQDDPGTVPEAPGAASSP